VLAEQEMAKAFEGLREQHRFIQSRLVLEGDEIHACSVLGPDLFLGDRPTEQRHAPAFPRGDVARPHAPDAGDARFPQQQRVVFAQESQAVVLFMQFAVAGGPHSDSLLPYGSEQRLRPLLLEQRHRRFGPSRLQPGQEGAGLAAARKGGGDRVERPGSHKGHHIVALEGHPPGEFFQ